MENGLHKIYIRSSDGIEYSTPYELPIKVVNIGATINSPINGSELKKTVEITGTSFGGNVREVLIKIGDGLWLEVEPEVVGGNLSTWVYSWDTSSLGNGKYTLAVKAYNGEWYSIPNSIVINVKNSKSDSGFLPSFDWIIFLLALTLIIIFKVWNRNSKN